MKKIVDFEKPQALFLFNSEIDTLIKAIEILSYNINYVWTFERQDKNITNEKNYEIRVIYSKLLELKKSVVNTDLEELESSLKRHCKNLKKYA